jgi:hypothetical protein
LQLFIRLACYSHTSNFSYKDRNHGRFDLHKVESMHGYHTAIQYIESQMPHGASCLRVWPGPKSPLLQCFDDYLEFCIAALIPLIGTSCLDAVLVRRQIKDKAERKTG